MPQFNPFFFPSQIFWLVVCFAVFYLAMSKIYLPRISQIIVQRKKVIEDNSSIAQELQKKIDDLKLATEENRQNSSKQYHVAMEQAAKQALLNREQILNDLKRRTDHMISHSEKQINELIENSRKNSDLLIKNLIDVLSKKLLQEQSDTNSIAINHNE